MFVCLFVTGRMQRSGKLPVLNSLIGQKIRFFAPQRRLVAPIHVNLGMADGHVGLLGCATFCLSRRGGGWECGRKYQNVILFGKVQFGSNLTCFASQATALSLRNRASVNLAEFFRAPCRKNYALDRNDDNFFDDPDELYHHAKFGEDCTTRAGCRCEKMCVFFCVTLRGGCAVC